MFNLHSNSEARTGRLPNGDIINAGIADLFKESCAWRKDVLWRRAANLPVALGIALFCACSAKAVTLTATATAVGAGDPTPKTANVSGGTVGHLYLVYQIVGSTYAWNTNEMTSVSAEVYTGYLPPLAGSVNVEWYVTDGTVSSATTTTTLAVTPDYNRYHDGKQVADETYGWELVGGSGSNWVARAPNGSQWKASGVNIGTKNVIGSYYLDTTIGMAYPTLYFYNLPPSEVPFIRSPKLEGGVGTIDFRTKAVESTVKTSEITVQIAYTDTEPTEMDWINVEVYKYGTQNGGVLSCICHVRLNDRAITYVRILRTQKNIYSETLTSGRISVDNICITKPAADVGIIEKLKNPGYPAADQNILMRCAVTNVCEETPAINRRVSVKYQYVARDTYSPDPSPALWSSADMAYRGKDAQGLDWYEGTIPTQRVGYVWYYYQVDYDGYHYGDNPLTGASESISPAYWDDNEDTHDRPIAGRKFQVRPYRSRYARIALEAQPVEATVSEMTLVGDEQWQAVTLVSGIPAVTNYFVGYGYYEDDAEAYEANPVMWGENNPDALSDPTLAGFLESTHDTTVTNSLIALNEKNYTGFYLYRFSSNDKDAAARDNPDGDRRYDYIVKKAVYQDFDDWTASPTYYEESLGGLPTLTFTEDFDGNASSAMDDICIRTPWLADGYAPGDTKSEDFQDDPLSDEFNPDDVDTTRLFIRTGSRVLVDRKARNTDTTVNRSMALNLFGKIQNTKNSIPFGLEKITFKARASIDDDNFAVYKKGTDWNTLPQYISASWQLTEVAPSKPYFAYIFLYQPSVWDGFSWYELRIIQTDSANANNDTVNIELWKHLSDGTETRVGYRNGITGRNLRNSHTVNVLVDKNGNNLRVRVHLTGGNPSTIGNNTTANSALIQDSSPINLTTGGTVGFGVFDASVNITAVKVGSTNGGTDILSSLGNTYSDWHAGGKRPDGQNRWTITNGAITRSVPAQTIDIYAANCIGGETRAENKELYKAASRTVNTLTMTDMSVDFKAWNKKFVQIRYGDGDGGIVLDDVSYYPWRATTRNSERGGAELENGTSYLDWTSIDQQEEWLDRSLDTTGDNMKQRWAVLEGWVTNSGAFKLGAEFDRTRANTNLVQGIVAPELLNGIGSCSFSYAASGGKVVYGVERTGKGDYHSWTPVAVYTNAPGQSGERYAKIGALDADGHNYAGRIRIRIYGAHDVGDILQKNPDCGYDPDWGFTDDNARLLIDNLRVKDYPEDENDNAWNAYNLLVTGDAPDGQIYNNSGKSCFFNNSPTNGVYGVEEFNADDPYLESPPLRGVGVGEIAFQYRLVPGTGTGNGHLVIKVAPRRDTPLAEWKTITNLVVSADGAAFVKFDNEKIFDENNYVVRFYNSKLPGTPRIVIDNVLVTAPARPSFEFEYVKLLPEQPLSGTNTVVDAKIMREIMNPKDVKVYVSWHKFDTNDVNDVWGVANWFNPITSDKVELRSIGEKVYRTPEGSGIPAFDVDDIVEFVVWGVHDAIDINAGDTPIKQGEDTFEVPAWYRTVNLATKEILVMDMNADKASDGWSPYYWVFSCPPGTFFINEFNNWRTTSAKAADYGSPEYIEFAGPAGADIGGWRLAVVHNENYADMEHVVPVGTHLRNDTQTGWGFYVWGDSCSSSTFIINEGGTYERDNIPFDVNAAFPGSSDPTVRNLGSYAGVMIYRSNGMIEECVRFGTANPSDFDGEEDIWYYAGRKAGSGSTSPISRFSLNGAAPGATSADFVWWPVDVANDDDYAEFEPEQTPGAPNDMQVLADLGGGVVVALYDPDGNEITDEDVLDWIEKYGAEQSDIDALGTMDKFNEEFLLDLDLTKDCVAELKITSIRIEDGVVYLGVQLTRTENNVAVGTRKINGTLKLLGRADLATGTFTALQPDPFDDNFETGNTIGIEYELPPSNPPKFFKVIVE